MLKGAVMFGQSGGPTSVINSSAAGVFLEALKHPEVMTKVYGANHGIVGILNEEFYDIGQEDIKELELLKNTPSSNLGSVRYKLKDIEEDESDYKRLLEVFKKYDIRYFFYNGGNDSMDTCNKISKYLKSVDYECKVIGVPKTIDNDLFGTDHCPGYGSAAKYIATTIMELSLDAKVYNTGQICVVEVMGRNAGWLTAAASLANKNGLGADLIYLPEIPFEVAQFVEDVKNVCEKNDDKCMIVVSEGIKDKDGNYIGDFEVSSSDLFGHSQLGGVASYLGALIKEHINVKVRAIEFSIIQRCAAHLASKVDVEEAFMVGKSAVKYALEGYSDKLVVLKRDETSGVYKSSTELLDVEFAANTEKTIPLEWIKKNGTGLTDDFIKYALPLIQGDCKAPLEDGLPRFANLKKVIAKKY